MSGNVKVAKRVKRIGVCIFSIFTSLNINAADRLFFEGFESGSIEGLEGIVSQGTQKITASNPYEGNFAVRGNLNNKVLDPITQISGTGLNRFYLKLNEIKAIDILSLNKYFVRYRFRFDDCRWDGTGFGKSLNDPHTIDLKMAYLMMDGHPESSFYVGGEGGENGNLTLAANNDTWMKWSKSEENWGKYTMYLNTNTPFGSDGQWHSFGMLFEKGSNANYLTLYIDDSIADRGELTNGRIKLPSDFLLDSLQILYTGSAQVNQSTNRTGVCNAWQIDDIEIWDGLPVDKRPQSPPFFSVE